MDPRQICFYKVYERAPYTYKEVEKTIELARLEKTNELDRPSGVLKTSIGAYIVCHKAWREKHKL